MCQAARLPICQIETFLATGASQQDIGEIGNVREGWCYIYLHFAKPLGEKVNHCIKFSKLKKIVINGKVGVWIHNFL